MKVYIHNFRCHSKVEFLIPKGLSILSGPSGIGKSSLLEAITFALTGKTTKPLRLSKNCIVELEIDNLRIIRKYPNVLKLHINEKVYEENTAQSIVDSTILNSKLFRLASYIPQNTFSSILSVPPREAKELLETFGCPNVSTIKEKIKGKILEIKNQCIEVSTEIQATESFLREIVVGEKINKPETSVNPSSLTILKNERQSLKKKKEEIEKTLQQQQSEIERKEKFEHQKQKLETELETLESQYADLPNLQESQILEFERQVKMKKQVLENLILQEDIQKIEQTIKEDTSEFFQDIQNQLNAIPEFDMETIQKRHETYKSQPTFNDLLSEVQSLFPKGTANIKKPETLRTFLVRKLANKKECIYCSKEMYVSHYSLYSIPKKELKPIVDPNNRKKLQNILTCLETAIETQSEPQTNLEPISDAEYEVYVQYNWDKKRLINILNNKNLPKSIEKQINQLERKKLRLETNLIQKCTQTSKDLSSIISKESSQLSEMWLNHTSKTKLKREILNRKNTLSSIEKFLQSFKECPNNLNCECQKISNSILEISEKIETLSVQFSKQKEYETYQKKKQLFDNLSLKKQNLETQKQKSESSLLGYKGLMSTISEAETLAFEDTLTNLNVYAKKYLDELFDTPISVRLKTLKQNKTNSKTRAQVSVQIEYKNNIYESTSSLSGGERQRCELAYVLAMFEMSSSPILFLDECLNNLDETILEKACRLLRNLAENKYIVVVSHEANIGMFDSIIEI